MALAKLFLMVPENNMEANHHFHLVSMQWCNLTLARRFWATKVCLRASKISKICLFGGPTRRETFWEANFENYSR